MLNMIHVCLENKITTFDHADISTVLTPLKVLSAKHLLPVKAEKKYS
jgi:predicted oxidoreductase